MSFFLFLWVSSYIVGLRGFIEGVSKQQRLLYF